jgi:hypothetical protein
MYNIPVLLMARQPTGQDMHIMATLGQTCALFKQDPLGTSDYIGNGNVSDEENIHVPTPLVAWWPEPPDSLISCWICGIR